MKTIKDLEGFEDICDEKKYFVKAGGHQDGLAWCDGSGTIGDQRKKEEQERWKDGDEREKNKNLGPSITQGKN